MQTNTTITPQFSDVQRVALCTAEAERWLICVEASDGQVVRLSRGHPARRLVFFLGDQARAADDRATRAELHGSC